MFKFFSNTKWAIWAWPGSILILSSIWFQVKIDVRIIGEEYKHKQYTGKDYCAEKGIKMYYNSRDHRFSSTGLRKQVKSAK